MSEDRDKTQNDHSIRLCGWIGSIKGEKQTQNSFRVGVGLTVVCGAELIKSAREAQEAGTIVL